MAICRFHRRGNATWVKVFNIGCSICNSPCKPAKRLNFRAKCRNLAVILHVIPVLRHGNLLLGNVKPYGKQRHTADKSATKLNLGLKCQSLTVCKRHFAAVGCAECHFTSKCLSLAVCKRHFADFIGEVMQLGLKFLTLVVQSAICRQVGDKAKLKFKVRRLALVQKAFCRASRQLEIVLSLKRGKS